MIKNRKWNVGDRDTDREAAEKIAAALGIEYITAKLLCARGYRTPEEANSFIRLETELFPDPFLMKDMDLATDRILSAINNGEKMTVYGDYDVDGVTSTALLRLWLTENGGDADYYIPSRAGEGYGVNREAVGKLAERGTKLIITVDTGITAVSETEYAKELGCDVVITDHHECHGPLPSACAVVNPKRSDCSYPFKELAGVGVAFKLVTALEYTKRRRTGQDTDGFLQSICRKYIDLAAIGTVADVMPLREENRLIVSMGLSYMNRSARPGVRAIIDAADGGKGRQKKAATSSLIGYTVAPRINAAGRMGSASLAAELFFTQSETRAAEIAEELCAVNRQRQLEENRIIGEIRERITADPSIGEDRVIVLADDSWHHGVIGIVASRVTEKYSRPSVLISFEGGTGKGSGRSVRGLNLVDALGCCSDLLLKYGGHELAAGLSIEREKLPEFRKRINEYAAEHLAADDLVTDIDIDTELFPSEATLKQAEELSLLEPFGASNPVPVFLMRGLSVVSAVPIGDGKHTKLTLERDGIKFSAVRFGATVDETGFVAGDTADVVFNLSVNEFMGNRSVQLLVRDCRMSEDEENGKKADVSEYEAAMRGEEWACRGNIPGREDFVGIYLRLKRAFPGGKGIICLNTFLGELNATPSQSGPTGYVKLRLALAILDEGGVITLEYTDTSRPGAELAGVTLNNPEKKAELEKTCLYRQLTNPARTSMPV